MVIIVQNEHPTLRKIAKEVPRSQIQSKKLGAVLDDMRSALLSQHDGVAIAAPQINIPLRIFIVSRKVFSTEEKNGSGDKVFINPIISKLSKKTEDVEEGCLSVRWKYGKVKRAVKATVTAYDEQGKKFTHSGSGLLAQIFQHETDHLDGILFIDKAHSIEDIVPEKN